jgi:hypothetical protein
MEDRDADHDEANQWRWTYQHGLAALATASRLAGPSAISGTIIVLVSRWPAANGCRSLQPCSLHVDAADLYPRCRLLIQSAQASDLSLPAMSCVLRPTILARLAGNRSVKDAGRCYETNLRPAVRRAWFGCWTGHAAGDS